MSYRLEDRLEQMILSDLPHPILTALACLGRDFRKKGIALLLFGSFAQGNARPNSDLDIAWRWEKPPDPQIENELRALLDRLPTIRPIDLVDLRFASDALVRRIMDDAVPLETLAGSTQ